MTSKPAVCKNVFKNGLSVPDKQSYTQIWIALINQLERSQAVLSGAK